jgi:hypothetical protein
MMRLLATAALLATVRGEKCQPEPATPCKFTCTGADGAVTSLFDLSTIKLASPAGYLKAVDSESQDYYVGICGAVESVTCAVAPGTPIAIQTWYDPAPPHFPTDCASLGSFATQSCSHEQSAPGAPPSDLVCSYTGGSASRKIDVRLTCGAPGTQLQTAATQLETMKYQVQVTDPSLCMQVPPPPATGLSKGSLFLILFAVSGIVYVGGGSWYNVKYRQMEPGSAAIPQVEYWRELPGLVRDGMAFSWKQTKKWLKRAQNAWRGGGDKNKGLIEADEDGEDYEERS